MWLKRAAQPRRRRDGERDAARRSSATPPAPTSAKRVLADASQRAARMADAVAGRMVFVPEELPLADARPLLTAR